MKLKKFEIGALFVGVLILGSLIWYNIKVNKQFLETPSYAIINIIVAVVFAYYFNQTKNNRKYLIDSLERLIIEIKSYINQKEYYEINDNTNMKTLTSMQRLVNNKICILSKYCEKIKINNKTKDIEEKFESYCSLIGDHYNDKKYLEKSRTELQNFLQIIDNDLDQIICSIYI